MSYLDRYNILNLQISLINIYESAIHFCKNIQEDYYCIWNYSNIRFDSQKLKTGNLIERIYYLFNDTKTIIPKFLPNIIKDEFGLEKEITANIFHGAKQNVYLSPHPLDKTMTNLSTTFNIIGIYNFCIQEYPEHKSEKRSRVK